MTAYAIDYAYARPSPAKIKASGFEGVLRYVSHSPGKNLTRTEADALLAAGLHIALVWETTANRAGEGWQAGHDDAVSANAQAASLGYPLDCPIFYAVDFDATNAQVYPYFNGCLNIAHWPVGIYGGIRVVDEALRAWDVPYGWQTVAWSHGVISNRAHLYQRLGHQLPDVGGDYDENVILRPYPAWGKETSMHLGDDPAGDRQATELAETHAAAGRLEQKVDALRAKVDQIATGNIDYAALAKAVNDDAAARLAH